MWRVLFILHEKAAYVVYLIRYVRIRGGFPGPDGIVVVLSGVFMSGTVR